MRDKNPWFEDGNEEPLPEPKTPRQQLVRRLAEAAMSVTHHDAADTEDGYIHEVRDMERKFSRLLHGKLKPKWSSATLKDKEA